MKNFLRCLLATLAMLLSLSAWAVTIAITLPTANSVINAGAIFTLIASTSGTGIAKVEFYQGTTLIGTSTSAPYSITWSSVASGSYSLTAKAKDSAGTVLATSSAVPIVIDVPPTVSITSPTRNQGFATGSNITLTATAADSDGSVTSVQFTAINMVTLAKLGILGMATTAPYTVIWSNVPAGKYQLYANATDNVGVRSVTATLAIIVADPPTVSLTSPTTTQSLTAPANVTLAANATASAGGTISKVEFYQGTTLVGTATASPYTVSWTNVVAGSYSLTAKAIDSRGISAVSAAVPIVVHAAGPAQGIYFIHPDHLGTPRLITDTQQAVVWRWDNQEPFGNNPPNEDPSASGRSFRFNLRFPGQYFDRETNLAYNYFRDYDSTTGRYIQSDPIGLQGGINTYSYVGGNPISRTDPNGLEWEGLGHFQQPGYDPNTPSQAPSGVPAWWQKQTPEKKCEYKCSMVVGSVCKPAYKVPTLYGKVGAYLACEAVVEYSCGWVCEHPEQCAAAAKAPAAVLSTPLGAPMLLMH